MKILSMEKTERPEIIQRLSDGSDRQQVKTTEYHVKVEHEGRVFKAVFVHEPTSEEVKNAINSGEAQESTDPADVLPFLLKKMHEQAEVSDLLLLMQLESEGIL